MLWQLCKYAVCLLIVAVMDMYNMMM